MNAFKVAAVTTTGFTFCRLNFHLVLRKKTSTKKPGGYFGVRVVDNWFQTKRWNYGDIFYTYSVWEKSLHPTAYVYYRLHDCLPNGGSIWLGVINSTTKIVPARFVATHPDQLASQCTISWSRKNRVRKIIRFVSKCPMVYCTNCWLRIDNPIVSDIFWVRNFGPS